MLGVSSPHRCFSPLLPQPCAVGTSSLYTTSLPFSPISSFTSPRIRVCCELYASTSGQRRRRGGPGDEWRSSEDDEEGEEGADLDLPMGEMRRWLSYKPKGFGEGKVYDTFVEERLLEEIEQSRSAQHANLAKLNSPTSSSPNSGKAKNNAKPIVDFPTGIPVHVSNLPKKKNIHRDLKLAFEGFPGIVTISPAVSGNKKTRDPICKGFAFVYLNSAKAAHRFVDVYSKKDIRFDKVEKRIICKTKDRHTSDSTGYIDGDLGDDGIESSEGFDIEDFDRSLSTGQDESVSGISIPPQENVLFQCDFAEDNHETIDILGNDKEETKEIKNGSTALSIRKLPKLQGVTKKQKTKQAHKKSSKLSVPGSAVRLKVQERAVLTDVLSKYNAKTDEAAPAPLM